MAIDFYHNPRCTTSRKALQMLRDKGIEPNIIERPIIVSKRKTALGLPAEKVLEVV